MGGFGWAVRQTVRVFQESGFGVDIALICCERRFDRPPTAACHGVRLVHWQPSRRGTVRGIRSLRLDALLTIDFRPSYGIACARSSSPCRAEKRAKKETSSVSASKPLPVRRILGVATRRVISRTSRNVCRTIKMGFYWIQTITMPGYAPLTQVTRWISVVFGSGRGAQTGRLPRGQMPRSGPIRLENGRQRARRGCARPAASRPGREPRPAVGSGLLCGFFP